MNTARPDAAMTADLDELDVAPSPQAASKSRKAWAPEAGSEVAATLRTLALQPWLLPGRDDETISSVRRNESAIRDALSRLGWVLIVERDLVRLRKSAPDRPDAVARLGPPPLTCSWFFLLVAAAESMTPRCGLAQLVSGARAAAAEAGLPVTGDLPERRAIVAALKLLAERGLVEPVEGNVEGFLSDENAPVLLAVHHTRLVHVIANAGDGDPSTDPQAWLTQVQTDPDPARRMRRRLVDDTCVHLVDLDDAEASWLSRRVRGDDGGPLAAAFGLHLERRSEGAAFVVPDDAYRHPRELGPLPFPVSGTVAHAALLLCDRAAADGAADGAPGLGWRGLSESSVLDALASAAQAQANGRGGWGRDLAEDPGLLASKVRDLLVGLSLLRVQTTPQPHAHSDDDHTAHDAVHSAADAAAYGDTDGVSVWWFAPVTGRWTGMVAEFTSPNKNAAADVPDVAWSADGVTVEIDALPLDLGMNLDGSTRASTESAGRHD